MSQPCTGVPQDTTLGARQAIRPPRTLNSVDLLKGAGAAICDQGLVSGANFTFAVLLARWMGTTDYGIFAVASSVLVFFTGAHSALLLEPMSVLGPARFSDDLHRYLKVMTRLNGAMALPAAGLLTLVGSACLVFQHLKPFGVTILVLAFSLPCLLFFQAYRRLCYVDHRPQRALAGSLIYAALLLLGAMALKLTGETSPPAAFALIGACGMVASLILLSRLISIHRPKTIDQPPDARVIWRDHWNYGRWILLASLTYWASTEIYYMLTAWRVGLEEAAAFRALQNLIAPAMQAMAALGLLLLPWVSTLFAERSPEAAMAFSRRITQAMTSAAVIYGLILWGFGKPIMRVVYAGHYASHIDLLGFVACFPILTALSTGSQMALRAAQRPWTILVGYGTSAALTATLGLAVVWRWGVEGAAFGLALSLATYALVLHQLAGRMKQSA